MQKKLNDDIKQQQKGRDVCPQRAGAMALRMAHIQGARNTEAGEMRSFLEEDTAETCALLCRPGCSWEEQTHIN